MRERPGFGRGVFVPGIRGEGVWQDRLRSGCYR